VLIFYFILAAVGGYLLGSIPFGLVLTRAAGLGDIRQIGSGNIGATNVLRTGRKDLALATLVLDAGKAGIALFLARMFAGSNSAFQLEIGLVAGFAAFIGHCFPVWLGFKGGKGVATYFGLLLVGTPPLGVVTGVTWIAVALIFRISSPAALAAVTIAPILALAGGYSTPEIICLVALAALIFWRHSANIARLRAGTEPRMGEKKQEEADEPVNVEARDATNEAPALPGSVEPPAPPAEPKPEA
jgi:glycerol-3-phosphate acyltransferase PlsY